MRAKQKSRIFDLIGWVGAGSLLTGFALVSFEVIVPDQLAYQIFNLIGASGLLLVAYKQKTYQFVLINGVWLAVAVVALVRLLFL